MGQSQGENVIGTAKTQQVEFKDVEGIQQKEAFKSTKSL